MPWGIDGGAPLHRRARHHHGVRARRQRPAPARGTAQTVAEARSDRPAGRRRRARLQQHPHEHRRRRGSDAHGPQGRQPRLRRSPRNQALGSARRKPDASAARFQQSPGDSPATADAQRRRRRHGHDAAAVRKSKSKCSFSRATKVRRSIADRAGRVEPRAQRPDAAERTPSGSTAGQTAWWLRRIRVAAGTGMSDEGTALRTLLPPRDREKAPAGLSIVYESPREQRASPSRASRAAAPAS